MVIYCSDQDYEAARIIAEVFGITPQKICYDIYDYIENHPGTYILVGGEYANPTVRTLVDKGLIKPIRSFYNKCVIQRTRVGESTVWVIAGWEKEHTLWIAKIIKLTGALPDMDFLKETVGIEYLAFDKGTIPKLYEIHLVSPFAIRLDQVLSIYEHLDPRVKERIIAHKVKLIDLFNAKWYILYEEPVTVSAGRLVSLVAMELIILIAIAIVTAGATIIVWKWAEAKVWEHRATIVKVQTSSELERKAMDIMKENPELAQYLSKYLEMIEKYKTDVESKAKEGFLEKFEKIMMLGMFGMMVLLGGIMVVKLIEAIK